MKRERYFYDREEEKVYTLSKLRDVYAQLKAENFDGDCYGVDTFEDWLRNATDKNGSLEEFTWYSIDYYVQNNFHSKIPVVSFDYETKKHTWVYDQRKYIVVPDYHECIVDVDGEIVAYGIHVLKIS